MNDVSATQEGAISAHFLGETRQVTGDKNAWTVSLSIQGSEVDFKIDTGADISVISENTFSSLKFKPKLRNVNAKIRSE